MMRVFVSLLFVALFSGGCALCETNDATDVCDVNSKSSVCLVVELFLDATLSVDGEMKIDSFALTDGGNVYTPYASFPLFCALWAGNYGLPLARSSLCRVCYPIDDISSIAGLSLEVYCSCFHYTEAGCCVVDVVQRIPLRVTGYPSFAGAFECCSFEYGLSLPFVLKCCCVATSHRGFFFL